jgi:hypothetical protein
MPWGDRRAEHYSRSCKAVFQSCQSEIHIMSLHVFLKEGEKLHSIKTSTQNQLCEVIFRGRKVTLYIPRASCIGGGVANIYDSTFQSTKKKDIRLLSF